MSFRILVVDDSRDTADSLAFLLDSAGHEAATAYDGEEALRAAESWRPHVVMLDLELPVISGYEVCRRIRQEPWGESIHIIAATGWDSDPVKERIAKAGFHRHLVKPIELRTLLPVLQSLPQESPPRN